MGQYQKKCVYSDKAPKLLGEDSPPLHPHRPLAYSKVTANTAPTVCQALFPSRCACSLAANNSQVGQIFYNSILQMREPTMQRLCNDCAGMCLWLYLLHLIQTHSNPEGQVLGTAPFHRGLSLPGATQADNTNSYLEVTLRRVRR